MQQDKDYQELRKLLLAPEQDALDKIKEDLKESRHDKVNDVADVLSDSLRLSTKNDKTLAQSLQPAVEDCIQQSVKQDAHFFADILFPIMGPAIRKSIADALKEVVDSINQAMEQSFSKEAIKWRWQSFTTGKSYGEIVLKNTLLYRVDQVFLINRDSGLLMQYVSHPDWKKGKDKMDSDAISAMLTAIQDFMHDSFNVEQSDRLDSIDIGDSTVLLSHGPKATLACKVQGNASHEIKNQMQEVLEDIHLIYFRDMEEFDGDRRSMQAVVPILEPLLLERKKQTATEKKKSFFKSPFFFIFTLVLLALIVFSVWRYLENKRFTDYVANLSQVPGVLITETGRQNGRFWVKGLRDPITNINQIKKNAHIDIQKIDHQFSSYQSLEPKLIRARAIKKLAIPEAINVIYEENTLSLSGHIDKQRDVDWYKDLSNKEFYFAGIDKVDFSKITFEEKKETLGDFLKKNASLIKTIDSTVLYFLKGDQLKEGEDSKLVSLLENISLLEKQVSKSSWSYHILITAYSDGSGSAVKNNEIKLKRAKVIKDKILESKQLAIQTNTTSNALLNSNKVDYLNRKATIQVIVK